jgi:hypothetical protein
MSEPINRNFLPEVIRDLIATTGATHVTITIGPEDIENFCRDLRWCRKTTINYYKAEVLGEIRP